MSNPNNANILAGVGPSAMAYFGAQDTAGPVGAAGTAGVQTVTVSGTPTAGTFTLTWNGYTTTAIQYNATATAVQSALNALPHGSTITVTGAGPYVCNFPAALPQVVMTAASNLTGGTSPSVSVVNTTPGTQTTTMATATIPTGFSCIGLVDQSGLVGNIQESSSTVKSYGSTQVQRVLISESANTFDIVFQETTPLTDTIYNRQPWGSLTADAQGHWSLSIGPASIATYAGLFDLVDGGNHFRLYCPRLQVANRKGFTIAAGKEISYGVTLQALPDANGNAVYKDVVVANLAAA